LEKLRAKSLGFCQAAPRDIDQGLLFSGRAIQPVEKILSVAELMASLTG
jgi:hypothetical protein